MVEEKVDQHTGHRDVSQSGNVHFATRRCCGTRIFSPLKTETIASGTMTTARMVCEIKIVK